MGNPAIYMDYQATTPVDLRVLDVMLPYFTQVYGNAASVDHAFGGEAFQAVQRAREQVAAGIHAKPDEIIFVSGATEANNLALIGAAERYQSKGRHIVTVVTEHPAVLDPCHHLERRGWELTYLGVQADGQISLEQVAAALRDDTVLLSVMAANNEIGVLAPLVELGQLARERGALFHTDATQAVGKIPIDVQGMHIDLLSMSAHKLYGPKGVGALYVRKLRPRVHLTEQMHGGGHERGMRSGTLNVPGIVGLGAAVELSVKGMHQESVRLTDLRNRLMDGLQAAVPGSMVNGSLEHRLPGNLSVSFPGIQARSLLVQLKSAVALSTGSACSTLNVEPSHVIAALSDDPALAYSTVRFGLGRWTTEAEVDAVIAAVGRAVGRLRQLGG